MFNRAARTDDRSRYASRSWPQGATALKSAPFLLAWSLASCAQPGPELDESLATAAQAITNGTTDENNVHSYAVDIQINPGGGRVAGRW